MRNIKILIEFDGTDFCGWQFQPNHRTVQDVIQQVLKKIFGSEIPLTGSGRTDSGVHAKGQVANFKIEHNMSVQTIVAALNGNLPVDVRIISAEEVGLDFHSRFDARKRHYCYTITKRERALGRYYMWCYKKKLDIEKMQTASNYFLGLNDFESFCQAGADVSHFRCTVEEANWDEKDEIITLNISANRFLHNMVRIIVGTIVNVGVGYTAIEDIPKMLESLDRRMAGPTAPAKGLCLEKVYY